MHSSPRFSKNSFQQNERNSMLSTSSGGSSTLMDHVSQKQRRQKGYFNTNQANRQQNFRKFTSSVSKPGQARETREAISRVLSAANANPFRPPPLAEPIDYEKFITEKSAQLENDRDRDMLLFFRDDVSGSEIYPRERTAVPSIRSRHIEEANWLLAKDALKFYCSPYTVINFNYLKFAGDFKKFVTPTLNSYLRFESDMILDEEKLQFAEQNMSNEVLKEGNLVVLPGDSISEKKRYCILRRLDDCKVYIEVYKQNTTQQLFPALEVKSAQIKGTKRGKTLQVCSVDSDKRTLLFSAENESDLQFWLFEIDRAIATKQNKDVIASEDSASLNSSLRENSVSVSCPTAGTSSHDSESLASEDSAGVRDSISLWRGKNATAKALRPPIVERNNLFALYWDMESLPEPSNGEWSTLAEPLDEIELNNAKSVRQIVPLMSAQKLQPKKSLSMLSTDDTGSTSTLAALTGTKVVTRESSPDPSHSELFGEKSELLITAQVRQLELKARFSCRDTPEQIEPFFIRLFLFDASLGNRISEEFHIEIPTLRYAELRNSNSMVVISSKQHNRKIHGISKQRIQSADKLICPIQNPRPDLYLVAIVERILSDIPVDIYTKPNNSIDAKTSVKIQKSISASFLRLSHLKSTFAWTATPIFPSLINGGSYSVQNSCIRNCPIYKCDGRLTDADLQKLLIDMQKPERTVKWLYLPNVGLTLMADITSISHQIPMCISSTYHPLRPWKSTTTDGNDITPSFELQSFFEQSVEPHRGFTNLLYVYPISLNYSAQKTFTRARNIVCNIKWICNRHLDKNSSSRSFSSISSPQSSPIFNRIEPNGPLVKSYNCAVQYHEQWPFFNDEVKIQLPVALESTDHLLFTFSHVSVANALSGKQNNEHIETPIGYSWLPFTYENNLGLLQLIMSSNVEEFELPVAANLPKNYFNFDLSGDNKEGTISQFFNSEMPKLVDGGKKLFKVRLRLISTIFTTDERIQNFFQLCQSNFSSFDRLGSILDLSSNNSNNNDSPILKKYNESNACSVSDLHESLSSSLEQNLNYEQELANVVDILASVDNNRIIPFVEVILNRLFSLLTISKTQELALSSLGTIVKLVDSLYVGRNSGRTILRNYIRLHFNSTIGNQSRDCETLHSSICKLIPALFNKYETGNDLSDLDIQCLLRQLWFLLDCCTKSMAHWLILSNLIRAPRSYRFPSDQYFCLEELFHSLMEQIIEKHNKFPKECRSANSALAVFLKYCLSLMDRHQIMKELYGIVRTMDSVGSRNFRIYKFELLHVLTGYEHWIPLCLPLLTDKYGNVMRGDSIIFDGLSPQNQPSKVNGSGGFFSKLFSHIFSPPYASHESNEIDRYSNTYSEHFYCSETYCSVHFIIGLLFQELSSSLKESREYRRKIIRLLRNLLAKHCQDKRYGDTSARNRIAILYLPLLRFVTEHVRELEATHKGVNKSESPILSPVTKPKVNTSDYSSLSSTGAETLKHQLASAINTPSNKSHPSSNSNFCRSSNLTTSSLITNSPSQFVGSRTPHIDKAPNSVVVLLAEKLDKSEVRDLIITSLYVLSNIPKKILAAFWNSQETTLFSTKIQQQKLLSVDKNNSTSDEPSTARQQPQNLLLDFIRFLELSLLTFRYRGRSYHIIQQEKRLKNKHYTVNSVYNNSYALNSTCYSLTDIGYGKTSTTNDFSESFGPQSTLEDGNVLSSFQLDCHLSQEVALVVLECIQIIANQVSLKTKYNTTKYYDTVFVRLLNLELELLSENWPDTIRLQTLAALAVFVNHFSSRFFHSGPLDCLSTLVKTLLLQLNSRISRIQTSAAALLQLILKGGFDASTTFSAKLSCSNLNLQKNHSNYSLLLTEKLGRPGAQISVALARLLSEKQLDNFRFERGLIKIESLVAGTDKQQQNNSSIAITSLFERAVLELVKQLRGVLEATRAISDMVNNPIQMADLHVQLADSYRGSAALRSEFFDALSNIHIGEGWYSEAAVCQAHSLAIVGKELQAKGFIAQTDWTLLNILNEQIAIEEELFNCAAVGNIQLGGFTIEDFTRKVDELVRTLLLSERYEAIGPIYRLSIPIFEKQLDFKYLVGIYAELQQACSRAAEVKLNAKRHLGSYFKVVFYGQTYFGDEHKTEWVYREPRLTSLAEACDHMIESVRLSLTKCFADRVQLINDKTIDEANLDPSIAFIQVAYVEPSISNILINNSNSKNNNKSLSISSNVDSSSTSQSNSDNNLAIEEKTDSMSYNLHTNIWTFIQEEKLIDAFVDETEQEMARTALRRLILTVESPFPNTRRRQRIVRSDEHVLTPLELACECLIFKAGQIRKILASADIQRSHYGIHDKETLKRLDLKQLQLFLQGSVSPTVNAGLLAYAEAFTSSSQKQRYGKNGIGRLVMAFKTLIAELDIALRVNEAALAGDRVEYQSMLRQSFDGMLERLSMFFEGEKFLHKPGESDSDDTLSLGVFGRIERTDSSAAEMHIFDSISGLNG